MAAPVHGWTTSIPIAGLRADPSGVQGVSTTLQASLFPGMSTVTQNVRYLSLFSGAKYWRQIANERGLKLVNQAIFLRRLEAIIALASVLHHKADGGIPTGVVGITFANAEVSKNRLSLDTGIGYPPYNIYRGTAGDLRLFDLNKQGDPLYEQTKVLGQAWNIGITGKIGEAIKKGTLPESLRRSELEAIADSFCLCSVPLDSDEQISLVNLLFGMTGGIIKPNFTGDYRNWGSDGSRITSWRLLTEIIYRSSGRVLDAQHMMARLLEPDLIKVPLPKLLTESYLLWRWVASRSLFERGWTNAFIQAFEIIRSQKYGLTAGDLLVAMRDKYIVDHNKKSITDIFNEVKDNYGSAEWIINKFDTPTPENCIKLMITGSMLSGEDITNSKFQALDIIDSSQDIPFKTERERLYLDKINSQLAADYWANISLESIIQHTYIALVKMAQGNPDTQHVEYEDGRWVVPPKRDIWNPRLSEGTSRLDIALRWLQQLRIIVRCDDDSFKLTNYGEEVRKLWDEVYSSWL